MEFINPSELNGSPAKKAVYIVGLLSLVLWVSIMFATGFVINPISGLTLWTSETKREVVIDLASKFNEDEADNSKKLVVKQGAGADLTDAAYAYQA